MGNGRHALSSAPYWATPVRGCLCKSPPLRHAKAHFNYVVIYTQQISNADSVNLDHTPNRRWGLLDATKSCDNTHPGISGGGGGDRVGQVWSGEQRS